jgi:hypothetical protein
MRGGFTRPVAALPYALPLLVLITLSGCSLFRPSAPPPEPEPPIAASEPEMPASEPEEASAPEAASAPEETAETKPAQKKPRPAPIHRRRPAPPPPVPASAPVAPAPAPLVTLRTIERGSFRTLLDSAVQKTDGKVVGRAVDLVTGPDGKPTEVVVNLQGFMGVGDRKAVFPWSVVRVNTQPALPAITLALGPGQQPIAEQPRSGTGAGVTPPAAGEPSPTRLPMLDATVERTNGAKVGRVVDVLLDGSADPLAVVLDVSGTLEKRHTIAAEWSALHFVRKNNELTAQLEMSDQQVEASPEYENGQPVRAVTPAAPPAPAAPAAPAASAPPPAARPATAATAAPATAASASAASAHGAK